MILFVFEGKDDKIYFESIKRLFFPEKLDTFVCTYNSNIYSLYTKLKAHDALKEMLEVDTVSVLKEILLEKGDETLKDIREDEVSEIYDNQLTKYVGTRECKVAILNAFPIFLFDYFGNKIVSDINKV